MCYEQALRFYQRIHDPYSIGCAHEKLAQITSDAELRGEHIETARAAWRSIGRTDLVETLDLPAAPAKVPTA